MAAREQDALRKALDLVATTTGDQPWQQKIEVPAGVAICFATLHDLASLAELEAFWHNEGLASDEGTLRRRIENHPAGQLVAVAPDGKLLGVMYSQRVPSIESLMNTTRARELELHTASGPVVHLLAVLQRPEANRVGDLIRRTMLQYGKMDPTVERACGVTRCRNFDPSTSDTSLSGYRAHVFEGDDPGLLFHTQAGAFICDVVPDYRPGDVQNLAYGVVISYEFRAEGRRAAEAAQASREAISRSGSTSAKAAAAALLPRSVAECEAIVIDSIGPLSSVRGAWDEATKRMGFMDLGIDSLDAQKLALNLNTRLGLQLNETVIFEQPNVSELAELVFELLGGGGSGAFHVGSPAASLCFTQDQQQQQHIAGASARWPGSNGPAFALRPAGGDGVGQIPSQRWDVAAAPVPSGRFGAFLPHAERFAGAFFGVSPAESSATDPQQRLLLECGYASLHAIRERKESLRAADTGVFLGIMNADFSALYTQSGSVYAATGGTISIAAGRLSFCLGTQGPCVSYDTACSSGLVAAHAASSAVRQGECMESLVLAASLMLSPQASRAQRA